MSYLEIPSGKVGDSSLGGIFVHSLPNAVSTSDEIDVSVDIYGITLEQPIPEGPRLNNEVHLSKVQLESLLRQMVKQTPAFRKQLKTILEETI